MNREERITYVNKYGITPPEHNCGSCSCLEDVDKGRQGGTCRITRSFQKFTNICDCPKQRYYEVELYPPPKIDYSAAGCKYCEDVDVLYDIVCYIPTENGSSIDIPLHYCPACGRKLAEEE